MAEAISLRHEAGLLDSAKSQTLLRSTFERATHSSVSPYRTDISSITDLGAFGYYLEHLNIVVGLSCALGDREYAEVNVRISAHLNEMSLTQDNAHARLLPHVKMRGPQIRRLFSNHSGFVTRTMGRISIPSRQRIGWHSCLKI